MIRTTKRRKSVTLAFGFVTLQNRLNPAPVAGCDTVTLELPHVSCAHTHTTLLSFLLSYCHKTLESALTKGSMRDTTTASETAYCLNRRNKGGEV